MNKKESLNEDPINNNISNKNINNIIDVKNNNKGEEEKLLYFKLLEMIKDIKLKDNYSGEKQNEIILILHKFEEEESIIKIINYINSQKTIINDFLEHIMNELIYENEKKEINIIIYKDKAFIIILSIIKIIINECIIYKKDLNIVNAQTNENIISFIFKLLIRIINSFCISYNKEIENKKKDKDQTIIEQRLDLLNIMASIFILYLNKGENFLLLNRQNQNILFQNMLKILIKFKNFILQKNIISNNKNNMSNNKNKNIKKTKISKNIFDLDYDEEDEEQEEEDNKINNKEKENNKSDFDFEDKKQLIIEYLIKILNIFYKKYNLDSEELNFIYNNKFNGECLLIIKNYIFNNNIQINNFILMIDLIDLITIYEYHNNYDEKIFSLSFMEKLKQYYKKINTMDSFIIKQRIQNTINYIKNVNNVNNKNKIYRVRYIINDIEKIRLKLINIINDNNMGNDKNNTRKIQKKTNNINNNKLIKSCYEKIKHCFFYYFDKIYNLDNKELSQLFISFEDKKLMIYDIIKIFSLILSDKENILFFIKDNMFSSIIEKLINSNDESDYKQYCYEQLFIIFDKVTENIIMINYYINNELFIKYILYEFSLINKLLLDLNNKKNKDMIYQNLKSFDIKRIKVISKIICELSNNKNLTLKIISLINYKSIYDILNKDNIEAIIVLHYIIIFKNILKLSQEEKNINIISKEKEIESLSILLINIIKKYNHEINILIEIMSIIEIKINNEEFIKKLINNDILNKIIDIYKDEKQMASKGYLPGVILINKLIEYDFSLNKIISMNLIYITKRVKENIDNNMISDIFVSIYQKIKNYVKDKIKLNKEQIILVFSYETINTLVEILIKNIDKKLKDIIENILEILSYLIELHYIFFIFEKVNNNNSLMFCLFKSINIYFNEINIVNYSIKILFRLFSQIKINKGNNFVELNLENKDDDLPDNLFFEESSDTSKIFNYDYFLNFINNNISKLIILYYNNDKINIIQNLIELIRIILMLTKSEINHKNLLNSFINSIEKFINYIINKDTIEKKDGFISDNYSFNLINHFSFLIFQLVSTDKEIIRKDFTSLLLSINNVIEKFSVSYDIIKRYLQILSIISIYSDKMELNKRISSIMGILDNIRNHKTLFIKEKKGNTYISNNNQIEIIFLFTKVLASLKHFDLDLINNNLYFILLHIPKSINNNKIIYSEKNYNEFKDGITELCSLYYIKSEKEALNIINHLNVLANDYLLLNSPDNDNDINNKIISELIFIVRIVKNLCMKTSLIGDEILKKENVSSFFMNRIKNYIEEHNNDNNDNNELLDEYDECLEIINNEQEYIDIEKDKILLENNKKSYLIGLTIGKENYKKMKDFLTEQNDVILYADDTCFKKCTLSVDENLNIIYVTATTNENRIRIDSMKIDTIYKISNDNSNEAFDINLNKTNSNKCFSLYSRYKKVKGTLLLEKDINIECYTEELCAKYVKTFNHLVELYKMMKE